ncbi:hypothetical protein [Halomonas sp. hl-4]|uniref:hypothetical protein n=1 Tax=Halomonas sp. hl-4 TaxID=1761789 RepID=UPI000BB7A209|nr:hypothetical protein [Halomonas sp. hl-4]SNY95533.1 hypothetical protein SAMN04488142_0033 [Halomonas sp. hl-4]
MSERQQLQIAMGALSPPLKEQIEQQGGVINEKELERLQRHCDAVTGLYIASYIPAGVAEKARQKIMKDIAKAVS